MPLLVRNMLSPLLLMLLLLPITLGCTTTSFNSTYDVYPDCAASSLACEDGAYTSNFANNCDYSGGECCTSQYHSAIAATWSCVRTNCDENLSLKAFKTFYNYCDEKKQPIEEQDIPEGYEAAVENKDSEDEKDNKDDDSSSGSSGISLSKGAIVGIVLGGGVFVIVLLWLLIKLYLGRRKHPRPNHDLELKPVQGSGPDLSLAPGGTQSNLQLSTIQGGNVDQHAVAADPAAQWQREQDYQSGEWGK
ncbi:hypothetical protein FALBO_4959 [Fusarium albosuccineum]|uniref:Extracellular membrane protein CFEM domain-containing protein n=1 Tax=Fusarium albosuccineum TaxID=1237068 RepID=A0A8H4LG33_9HYPO|nr:hypothetical protein FALBO_4959 [Fusarium albosuccineum]